MKVKVKYKFSEFPRLLLTDKGVMWQINYVSDKRSYGARIIEPHYHQGQLKYLINRKRVSKKRLNESAYW